MSPIATLEPTQQSANGSIRDEAFFEIVDGKRVELPPMSVRSNKVANRLFGQILMFLKDHDIGESTMEMLFRLPLEKERCRQPDVAFVSYERWPKGRPVPPDEDVAWEVAPDLAVEVVSPTDRAGELMTKIVEYLQAGVRQVWVVYPLQRFVLIYESLTKIRGVTEIEELDGGDVLPGFRTPLAGLFPEALPET
jgi:Uma2 family endonuclease